VDRNKIGMKVQNFVLLVCGSEKKPGTSLRRPKSGEQNCCRQRIQKSDIAPKRPQFLDLQNVRFS